MVTKKKASAKKRKPIANPQDLPVGVYLEKLLGTSVLSIPYWLSTGSLTTDLAISGGKGLPGGKVTEVSGDSASGKTAFALSICRQAQLQGGDVVYLDAEARLSDTLAEYLIEVDINNNFHYAIPANLEEGLDTIEKLGVHATRRQTPTVIVLDSIAALATQQQSMESGDLTSQKRVMGSAANMISWWGSRGILRKLNGSNVYVIIINQTRDRLDFSPVPGQQRKTTPGGHAISFYSQTRLVISQEPLEKLGREIGAMIKVHVKKNSVGPPHRYSYIPFYFEEFNGAKGMDEPLAWINYLISEGIVEKSGSLYVIGGVSKYKKDWVNEMRINPEFKKSIRDLVKATYTRPRVSAVDE